MCSLYTLTVTLVLGGSACPGPRLAGVLPLAKPSSACRPLPPACRDAGCAPPQQIIVQVIYTTCYLHQLLQCHLGADAKQPFRQVGGEGIKMRCQLAAAERVWATGACRPLQSTH